MIIVNKKKIRCPRCGAETKPAISINGLLSTTWLKCTKCPSYIDTTILLPHQEDFMRDSSTYIGWYGAYGSGKTFGSNKKNQKHIMLTTGGESLYAAKTTNQLENTIKKDFENDFPIDFLAHYNKQKQKLTFVNGHLVYYRPMDDEGKIRSMNLSRIHFLEASEIGHEEFVQGTARLRHEAALQTATDEDGNPIYLVDDKGDWLRDEEGNPLPLIEADTRQYIIESNPDSGWIRDDVLLKSGRIKIYGKYDHNYHVPAEEAQANKTSYIVPTNANYNLPKTFESEMAAGRPNWWVRRYLHGSFDYAEGLVYPEALRAFMPVSPIPDKFPRIIAMDYGLRDNTHFIFLAIDTDRAKVIAYDELVLEGMNIKEIAQKYKEKVNKTVPLGGLFKTPVMDGRSVNVRSRETKKPLGELFLEEGILFEPAQMDLNARILRLNTLIETGQLEIHRDNCPILCKELLNYKFPDKSLDATKKNEDKPIDANNHGINALEFGCMELPRDLKAYSHGSYDRHGKTKAYAYANEKRDRKRQFYNPLAPKYEDFSNQSYGDDDDFTGGYNY